MLDEIEELWALAEECREWMKGIDKVEPAMSSDKVLVREFKRLADKLDDIAKRLAGRMPT